MEQTKRTVFTVVVMLSVVMMSSSTNARENTDIQAYVYEDVSINSFDYSPEQKKQIKLALEKANEGLKNFSAVANVKPEIETEVAKKTSAKVGVEVQLTNGENSAVKLAERNNGQVWQELAPEDNHDTLQESQQLREKLGKYYGKNASNRGAKFDFKAQKAGIEKETVKFSNFDKINFDYKVSGKKYLPKCVWDDGIFTYVFFPTDVYKEKIFIVGFSQNEVEQIKEYVVHDGFMKFSDVWAKIVFGIGNETISISNSSYLR